MEDNAQSRAVKSRQLGQLLGLVPVMIHWLRDAGPESGMLLVKDVTNTDGTEVQSLLHRLLDAFNFSGDITIAQIKELGEAAGDKAWAGAIRKIVLDAEPALIPASIGVDLVNSAGDVSSLKSTVDRLPRAHYYALGELCSLFHDAGDSDLAALVGSRLIVHSSHDLDGGSNNSSKVMKQLINQCDILFGRAAGANATQRALGGNGQGGQRPSNLNGKASRLPSVSVQDALLNARKHALKAFFQWKDETRVECVDDLFANHNFVDIARGIWERYDALPGGWRGELEEMKQAGEPDAAWVPMNGASLGSPNGTTTQLTEKPVSMQEAQITIGKSNRRTLVGLVRGSKTGAADPPPQPQFSNLQLLINEILDSEVFYYSLLKDLQDNYVSRLKEIASGEKGPEARAALGISLNDVESVFGWRLAQVVETSKNLLARLEVINLVRNEVKHPGGRAMFVASAFAAIAPNLSVNYAPFVSGHRHAMNVLQGVANSRPASSREGSGGGGVYRPQSKRVTQIGARFSSRNLLSMVKEATQASNGTNGGSNSFLGIWEDLTEKSKRLKGQSLQSIMIMPIQRIPRYKLLLAELEKKIPTDHPAVPMLSTALTQVSLVAQQINQALRQHEKLENLVGAGDMPEISGAKNLMKNGAVRLTVNYKASIS